MSLTKFPNFIMLKYEPHKHSFFAYKDVAGTVSGAVVVESEIGAFNPMAKIEIDPSKTNSKYFHIRFSHNNKYWSRNNAEDGFIVAVSTKAEEDTIQSSMHPV
ncbi:hypothetical protein AAHA92_27037 [Salvia divinorum]|uniref:Uncharacterized protein n=1 Tax=Salvia divinorum TaxID=28513 RepID=A0ABD1G2E2_SALDI